MRDALQSAKPLGSLDLRLCSGVEYDETMHRPYCFKLIGPKRTLVMIGASQVDADSWVACLRFKLVGLRRRAAQ